MNLQVDDWVKPKSGEIGKVVLISGATIFVTLPRQDKDNTVIAFRASELTKVDSAEDRNERK